MDARAVWSGGAMLLGLLCVLAYPVTADIFVINDIQNSTIATLDDAASLFGPQITSSGISGALMLAAPVMACGTLTSQAPQNRSWIVLIRRGNCTFEEKVWRAQQAGFVAAIVYNDRSDAISPMHGGAQPGISVPSVFVGESSGLLLINNFLNASVYHLHITDHDIFDFADYLIPFAIIIAICFVVLVTIMIYRCYSDYRHARRHRLPRRALDALPTRRFCAAQHDAYDTCAICLDDYEEGDRLRILPCSHAYHAKCVDPWLTRSKRVCPVCKRRVLEGDAASGGSDDEEPAAGQPAGAGHEREPLLEPRARRQYGATAARTRGAGSSRVARATPASVTTADEVTAERAPPSRRPHRNSRRSRRQQRPGRGDSSAAERAGDVTAARGGARPMGEEAPSAAGAGGPDTRPVDSTPDAAPATPTLVHADAAAATLPSVQADAASATPPSVHADAASATPPSVHADAASATPPSVQADAASATPTPVQVGGGALPRQPAQQQSQSGRPAADKRQRSGSGRRRRRADGYSRLQDDQAASEEEEAAAAAAPPQVVVRGDSGATSAAAHRPEDATGPESV